MQLQGLLNLTYLTNLSQKEYLVAAPYTPISCSAYDVVEIACMYHYNIELTMLDGTHIVGQAVTTKIIKNDGEYLVLNGKDELLVRLDNIKHITALDESAKFNSVTINSGT